MNPIFKLFAQSIEFTDALYSHTDAIPALLAAEKAFFEKGLTDRSEPIELTAEYGWVSHWPHVAGVFLETKDGQIWLYRTCDSQVVNVTGYFDEPDYDNQAQDYSDLCWELDHFNG